MSLTHAVSTLGRGPGRSRSLTLDEAQAAMAEILAGDAPGEAVGALLMLLRMKGETAEEIAGFVTAARDRLDVPELTPALDWPVYAAGRTRGLPWFLLAARMVADAGFPVLLHGWSPRPEMVRAGLEAARIPVVSDAASAATALSHQRIAFWTLETLSPELYRLLRLREVFGLRSCVNTCLRVLNPFGATATVQGVFHPPYRELQADASLLLGQKAQTVIKGGGGEFERNPTKAIEAFGLRDGLAWEHVYPPLLEETRRLADEAPDPALLTALDPGPFAEMVITGTVALALETLGVADAQDRAEALWLDRVGLAMP